MYGFVAQHDAHKRTTAPQSRWNDADTQTSGMVGLGCLRSPEHQIRTQHVLQTHSFAYHSVRSHNLATAIGYQAGTLSDKRRPGVTGNHMLSHY